MVAGKSESKIKLPRWSGYSIIRHVYTCSKSVALDSITLPAPGWSILNVPRHDMTHMARMQNIIDQFLISRRDHVYLFAMNSSEVEVNPYELLEVKIEATEQEIRTAYRQRSLKVHPDRVRI